MPVTPDEYETLQGAIRRALYAMEGQGLSVETRHSMLMAEVRRNVMQVPVPFPLPHPPPPLTRQGPLSPDEVRAIERVLEEDHQAGLQSRPADLVQRIQGELARVPQLFSSRVQPEDDRMGVLRRLGRRSGIPSERVEETLARAQDRSQAMARNFGLLYGRQSGMTHRAAVASVHALLGLGGSPAGEIDPHANTYVADCPVCGDPVTSPEHLSRPCNQGTGSTVMVAGDMMDSDFEQLSREIQGGLGLDNPEGRAALDRVDAIRQVMEAFSGGGGVPENRITQQEAHASAGEITFSTGSPNPSEILRLTPQGEIYFRGRKLIEDRELVMGFRAFLHQAGTLPNPKAMEEFQESQGILARYDRKDPVDG